MDGDTAPARSGIAGVASFLGMVGGFLSLAVGLLVTVSVIGRWLFDSGVPGDFEFVKMGAALTVFFFLPACQARRGNIVVDTFTGFLDERQRNILDAVWDVVYALAILAIGYAMVVGTLESWNNNITTMVTGFPMWPALAISTALLFFLAAVCFWTARKLIGTR